MRLYLRVTFEPDFIMMFILVSILLRLLNLTQDVCNLVLPFLTPFVRLFKLTATFGCAFWLFLFQYVFGWWLPRGRMPWIPSGKPGRLSEEEEMEAWEVQEGSWLNDNPLPSLEKTSKAKKERDGGEGRGIGKEVWMALAEKGMKRAE